MSDRPFFEFDRQRLFTDVGTLILTRFLAFRPRSVRVENVETDQSFRRRDIDLIWHRAIPGREHTAVEIKCDSHAGSDEELIRSAAYPYYARRTENFAIETTSNDVSKSPGWVYGSEADMLLYYFVAIPCTAEELTQRWAVGEEYLLANLGVEGDRLYVLDLPELREWFHGAQSQYREVVAHNDSYRTVSRLVSCRDVVSAVKHCHVLDDVYRTVCASLDAA